MLAQVGAAVIGVARREAELQDWHSLAGPKAGYIVHDLSDRTKLPELAKEITRSYGSPDILVHAAGINPCQTADQVAFRSMGINLWLNLSLPFFLSELLIRPMQQKGWVESLTLLLQTTRLSPVE